MGQDISTPVVSDEQRAELEKEGRKQVQEWQDEARARRCQAREEAAKHQDQADAGAVSRHPRQAGLEAAVRRVDIENINAMLKQARRQLDKVSKRPAPIRGAQQAGAAGPVMAIATNVHSSSSGSGTHVLSTRTPADGISIKTARMPPIGPARGGASNKPDEDILCQVPTPASRKSSGSDSRSSMSTSSSVAAIKKEIRSQNPRSTSTKADGKRELSDSPGWYKSLKLDKTRGKGDYEADTTLAELKEQIAAVIKQPGGQVQKTIFNNIRSALHKVAFIEVNEKVLRKHRMLHSGDESGLSRIFDNRFNQCVPWPYDIKADAEELFHKWSNRIFDTDLLRGVDLGYSSKGMTGTLKSAQAHSFDRLNKKWVQNHAPPRKTGHNGCTNGQWWPTQLTAFRDGAHGVTQGGIYFQETDGEAAHSCVLSCGHERGYDDEDDGNVILYSGTDGPGNGTISKGTQSLINSVGSGIPVRVLRSSNANGPWAPKHGYRYDGLYDVVAIETKPARTDRKQRYRFKLVRCDGQDPIRGGNCDPLAVRPTKEEIEAYLKDKKIRGYGS